MKDTTEILETPLLDKILLTDWMKCLLYTPSQQVEIEDLFSNRVWITARKEKLHVREMETKHIKNCINCWNGKGRMKIPKDYLGGKAKWIEIFEDELSKRQ